MSEERIQTEVQMGILKPAQEVFEAIVDTDKMNKYFITTSTGRMESTKTITWSWEDYDVSHEVKVQNVEKDKLVSFK